jgi:hypothetical protein
LEKEFFLKAENQKQVKKVWGQGAFPKKALAAPAGAKHPSTLKA